MMFVCLLVALICCVNGYGDDVNVSDVYSVSTQTYTSTILQPYQWSYITVELPPGFSSLTIGLDTDIKVDSKVIDAFQLPTMCFRQGGFPLPDFSKTTLQNLVLYNVYDLPTMEAPALAIENQCYAIQGNITFTLTNEQITDGVLFIGIFNGIGAVRTQTKMCLCIIALVEACNETNFWGEFCDKKCQRLQCYPLKKQFSECSIDTCHLPDMSPKLVFLNVENMATALILFVEKISINNTKHGFSSLIVYARNGAIPTNKLFDYTIDLTRNQLTIQLPKIGVWYFYIVPIMNNTTTTSNHMKQLKQLCYVLKWKLIKGINHQERSIYHVDGTNYMSNFPLTKIFQKENIGNPWICYFVMELPANASTRNIRIEMESNTSIECEVYARFGGLASHEMYDYYYVNQTNNSDDGLSLFKLYASSNRSLKFDIVYAQQGKWSFELRRHNLMTRLESETYLSISLAACPNNCSGYGKCSISANAQTSYSYCECDIFHGGFDCSIKIVPKFEQKLEIVFLVGSNAAAILPAICALFKKSYAELVIFLSSGVASAIYHACDAQWVCVIQYRILQFMDFWLSFVAIISIFLYMTSLSEAIKRAILSVVWILTAFMAIRDTTSSTNIVFVLVLGIACLLVPWLLQISTMCRTSSNLIQRPKIMTSSILKNLKNICRSFGWGFLVAAFVALALAATSWKLENNKNYWICHSIWHISVYTAAFFFLCSKVNSENEGSKPNVDNDVMVVPSESSETIII